MFYTPAGLTCAFVIIIQIYKICSFYIMLYRRFIFQYLHYAFYRHYIILPKTGFSIIHPQPGRNCHDHGMKKTFYGTLFSGMNTGNISYFCIFVN